MKRKNDIKEKVGLLYEIELLENHKNATKQVESEIDLIIKNLESVIYGKAAVEQALMFKALIKDINMAWFFLQAG